MSYLVLARKYRPQTFAEIVGQEHVTRTLENAFARGRVHHAFLFCGARGVGKTTAARVLAKALCCEQGIGKACGECNACRTITDGTAVDYHEIDGASNNGVDDIRELRDGVRYQPAQLRRKIYVIDEVHMLSVAAFNALLKTLEEPPPHVTFIFATTEVHKIPVTILSRCQRYDFKLVPTQRLVAHLASILEKENLPVERGALNLLAREAGGSVRDALSLTDQVIAYVGQETISEARVAEVLGVADRGLLVELVGAVAGGNPQAALEAVNSAADRGVDVGHLSRTFLGILRDAALVLELKDPGALVDLSADEIAGLRAALGTATRAHLVALFDRFSKCCEEMKESPAPRLVLEIALLDMASTEPLLLLSELLERVADLEKRLKAGGGPPPPAGGGSPRPQRTTVTPPPPTVKAAPPPPAPAPAAQASRKAPDDPMAEWEQVIGALEKRNITLAGVFSHARLLDWNERSLAVGFAAGSLQGTLAADPDNLKKLKDFLAERYGSLDVQVKQLAHMPEPTGARPSEPAAATLAEVEHERRRAERERRESEARQHPATKAAMDTFGAAIKEIKVDG